MAGLPGVEGVQVLVIRYFLKFFEMVILEISQTESYTILFKRDIFFLILVTETSNFKCPRTCP